MERNVAVPELKDAAEFNAALTRDRLQVVELYTEWAGPTQAAKTAWRKLALDLGGGPLPFDLSTLCLDRVRDAAPTLAGFPLTSEPQWVMFRKGKQVAAVAGLDLPALLKAVQKYSAENAAAAAAVRESEC